MNNIYLYKKKYLKYKEKYIMLKTKYTEKKEDNTNVINKCNKNNMNLKFKIKDQEFIIKKYYNLIDDLCIPKVYDYNFLDIFIENGNINLIKLKSVFDFLNNETMNKNNKHIFNNIIFPFLLSMCSASYIKNKNKEPQFREKSFFSLIDNLDKINTSKSYNLVYDYITPFKKKYNSPTLLILGLKNENNIYINIACKGTTNYDEWIKNFNFESKDIMMEHDMYTNLKKSVKISNPKIRVHKGYYEFIQNVLELAIPKLNRLLNILNYNNSINLVINITGHSLGGGLATLFTEKIEQIYYNASINLITFSAPRVVNNTFKDYINLNRIYRIYNSKDLVTQHPTPMEAKLGKLYAFIQPILSLFNFSIFNKIDDSDDNFENLEKNIDSKIKNLKKGGFINVFNLFKKLDSTKNVDALHIVSKFNEDKNKKYLDYQNNLNNFNIKKINMFSYLLYHNGYCFDNDIFFTCGTPFKNKNTINKVFFKIF